VQNRFRNPAKQNLSFLLLFFIHFLNGVLYKKQDSLLQEQRLPYFRYVLPISNQTVFQENKKTTLLHPLSIQNYIKIEGKS
jgi:hypothetical protein